MKAAKTKKRESAVAVDEGSFAFRFKKIRTERGLKQLDISKALKTSVPTVSRLELGQVTPDAELILRIVKEYKCDLTWLMTGEGDPEGNIGEASKQQLLSQLKKDTSFRAEVLNELGLRPSSEVVRNARVYKFLLEQRADWVEIVDANMKSVAGASSVKKKETEERVQSFQDGIAYLSVLLEVGRDAEE